ncbi:hypothetical protein [Chromohalobacter israelensis]|uniref:Uncharacterized protein n=1 Tax=Chromohalobacter israelensis (strain ATCC BAA-138 / DSM 3043 / CIP 106854 / NCIMB 13768 / 1H11) TaxID=290398 RepID=Q1QYN7_CHRI1|nr:hypothetical protein [Chromohalobacter salexigens]ABE58421.1 hypothetical protein Csal_1064 [Chromohalobacter salexigens DSM 3043]
MTRTVNRHVPGTATFPLDTSALPSRLQASWMAAALVAALLSAGGPAEAGDRDPLVGPYPYDFPARASIQGSLLLQEARRRNSGSGDSGSDDRGSINAGAIVNNNSTSIAVGNWQQIEMTLGDGAEGLIMTENHQTNEAEANALSKINTTLNMEAADSSKMLSKEKKAK